MALFSRVKVWNAGEVLYASDLNGEFNNLLSGFTPIKIEGASATVSAMQQTQDPGELGSEAPAGNLLEEMKQIRFAVKEIKGTAQWYQSAAGNLTTGVAAASPDNTTVEINANLLRVKDGGVTTPKIGDGQVTLQKLSMYPFLNYQAFTSSGTFTVPAGVTSVFLWGYGGGQSGFYNTGLNNATGGYGGNGAPIGTAMVAVTPGASVAVTIGAGGSGNGASGGNTSFGSLSFSGGKSRLAGSTDGGIHSSSVLGTPYPGADGFASVFYSGGSHGGNYGGGGGGAGIGGAGGNGGVGAGGSGSPGPANSGAGGGGAGQSGPSTGDGGSGYLLVMW